MVSLEQVQNLLAAQGYITEKPIVLSMFLSMRLGKPLLVEGPAGVGKTEIAKVMAKALDTDLIRLQCYEGLDANHALYEWNYQQQLLYLKLEEGLSMDLAEREKNIFSEKFLLKRPLLQAITHHKAPVLLIDEIDRADEEFESFLLEVLSDWQITIPEIGTIHATHRPHVIVTSNRVRELSEALRRRCLYLYIDYPDFEKELQIVRSKVPEIDEKLGQQICAFMRELRQLRLDKVPGVAETLDWAAALANLHIDHLDKETVESTLGIILKDWQDIRHTQMSLTELFEKTGAISKFDAL
ncbi:AAA family ATPase [Haliscomenobacter hydrossis]|uniref:ATPase associated with various cellular activities AAA_5 n=1 Tax=Haliscomenobacter hydrossis (strain ATCC 27775 / DSM 1100 / LMG 10767 / O) TaxID=760192 RepID=F4L1Z4_HALH1|nr:MoxR family ATPase [Haliscomenobacter hydrossis]AEE50627.1 ATPase associated with various cellular activities AAA_5 [Haliscomenobacter hydrossis DSM 1100]